MLKCSFWDYWRSSEEVEFACFQHKMKDLVQRRASERSWGLDNVVHSLRIYFFDERSSCGLELTRGAEESCQCFSELLGKFGVGLHDG